MSLESSWDVQTAVYSRLTGISALTDLLAEGADSILDHVPPGTAFPYVVIGEMTTRPFDTQTHQGCDLALALHAYSQGSGMKEVKSIVSALTDALHDQVFVVPNQTLILCQKTDTSMTLEQDGVTRHGVIRLRIITE